MKRFSAVLLSAALLLAAMPFCGIGTVAADDAHDIAYICSHQESGILEYYSCIGDGTAKEPVVTINGLVKDTDFTVAYTANINPGNAKVTVTGIGSYSGTFDAYFEIKKSTDVQADRLFGTANRLRYPGSNRYATSQLVANALKTSLGVSKFEAIIVADGNNYPDALSGGFLAKKKSAPILTVSKAYEKNVQTYIENNLADNGIVYILGGTGVVSSAFETAMKNSAVLPSITVQRLCGSNRYDTNLAILEEAGVNSEAILVCSGNGYADSLSASAVGLPIMLVNTSLTQKQKDFLSSIDSNRYYIIGGTGAVAGTVETQIKATLNANSQNYSGERVFGSNRYKTSTEVAKKFFEDEIDNVVFAYANNFPDGLAGGPLAMAVGAPIILTSGSYYSDAKAYVGETWITRSITLGGTSLISDSVVNAIMKYS